MNILLLLALLGAEVLPTAGKAVGVVRDDTPGGWAVIAPEGEVAAVPFDGDDTKGYLGCYFEGLPGRYTVIKVNGFKVKTFAVVLGGVAPQPVPPGPGPVPPDPTPPPPPVGIKAAVLIWEWSKLPQPKPAVDTAVDEFLDAQAGSGNWRKWDDDFVSASFDGEPKFLGELKFLKDLYIKGKVDRASAGLGDDAPWVEIELKDGRRVGRALDDNTLQFLKSYGG
jgi:hypothetical protein